MLSQLTITTKPCPFYKPAVTIWRGPVNNFTAEEISNLMDGGRGWGDFKTQCNDYKHPNKEMLTKLMRRSIRNFNIPPQAYPGHLTLRRARGGGNLNVALEGWGI